MDKQTANFVMNLLTQLKPKMGILMITHKISLAEMAERTYQLVEGQIFEYKSILI